MALKTRLVVLALIVVTPLAAAAVAGATVRIPGGQVVEDIKVFGDDVRVDGQTRGRVVVIDGNLIVGSTGTVAGATVIGGRLRVEPGGRLYGEVFQLGGSWPQPHGWPALLLLALFLAVRLLIVWLAVSAATLLAPRPALARVGQVARSRPLRTLAVGALAGFGLTAASIVLAITLLGLAVAAALWGVLLLAGVVGLALTLHWAGTSAPARRLSFIALALPVVGDGLAALAAVLGLGALLRHASETRGQPAPEHALFTR